MAGWLWLRIMSVAVPPPPEQHSILGQIEDHTRPLNTAIARTEREIELMQEYRTRLTADVVTGKLDVRPAAARLTDLIPDSSLEPVTRELADENEPEEADAVP